MQKLEDKAKLKKLLERSRLFRKKTPFKSSVRMAFLFTWILLLGMTLFFGGMQLSTHKKIRRVKDRYQSLFKAMTQNSNHKAVRFLGNTLAPPVLAKIPYGETKGLVLGVKEINLCHVYAPFNASLIAKEGGYHLFFRYDTPTFFSRRFPFCTHIGVATLDKNLEQVGEMREIPLFSNYVEDPRVVKFQDQLCLIYNDLLARSSVRSMHLAVLDPVSLKLRHKTPLNLNLRWLEKNWSPFVYTDAEKNTHLMLEYQVNPHALFEISDLTTGTLKQVSLPAEACYNSSLSWERMWGTLRGGTQLLKVGDNYLGFFHSSFTHDKTIWYVMGAYSFNAEPPFYLNGISAHPILFEGIYDTALVHAADATKRVIFPCGFVTAKEGDRDVIHVACGENDCGIKIITLDQEVLLQGLQPVEDARFLRNIFRQVNTDIIP